MTTHKSQIHSLPPTWMSICVDLNAREDFVHDPEGYAVRIGASAKAYGLPPQKAC